MLVETDVPFNNCRHYCKSTWLMHVPLMYRNEETNNLHSVDWLEIFKNDISNDNHIMWLCVGDYRNLIGAMYLYPKVEPLLRKNVKYYEYRSGDGYQTLDTLCVVLDDE